MQKLRLLFTEFCNRSCEGCCNKDYDLQSMEILDSLDEIKEYDEIIITGGEPMLYYASLYSFMMLLRKYMKEGAKIYLYTAMHFSPAHLVVLSDLADGLVLTLHDQDDVENFVDLSKSIHFFRSYGEATRLHYNTRNCYF